MKLHHQTRFGGPGPEGTGGGNCWSTCIACILGVDPDTVPNFCGLYGDREWMVEANRWLAGFGIVLLSYTGDDSPLAGVPEYEQHATLIASGMGPRGHRHSVLWRNGRLLHDPHPSGDGIAKPDEWEIVVVRDLDALLEKLQAARTA